MTKTTKLTDKHRGAFETLRQAADRGQLALLDCTDAATGEPRAVLALVVEDFDGVSMFPLGHLELDPDKYLFDGQAPSEAA